MKRTLALSILFCFMLIAYSNAYAERYAIEGNVALKVDYFHFTDSSLGDLNAENGAYIGLEAYKQMFFHNFFLGGEIGYAGASGTYAGFLDTDINYVPIEFNAKYVLPICSFLNIDVGSGFSINYFDFTTGPSGVRSSNDDDWVWGGQVFAGLNYKYQNWLMGVDFKYQVTQDLHLFGVNTGTSADNARVGAQVGYAF